MKFLNNYMLPRPITIRIAYEWTDRNRKPKAAPPDKRYAFIRDQIKLVAKEVANRVTKHKGNFDLSVHIGRMRALHGSELLPRFRELCNTTDIIVFDITGENPNVMLELGMAMSAKADRAQLSGPLIC